ncbi:MAG: T9SS type A sorting domain-containing protein [Saprospiraceae bacterium]|nr:T9SS type A sorting domain-containing protein [Saprospiraceae bacterium]
MLHHCLKPFIFFLLLSADRPAGVWAGTHASDPETAIVQLSPSTAPPGPCDLAAPANLWVTGMGSTSVAIAWTPVAGAAGYMTRLTSQNSTASAAPLYVTGTTAVLQVPMPGLYTISVVAIAPGCPPSINARQIGPLYLPIITELIAVGRSVGSCLDAGPDLIPCGQIPNSPGEYWFSIKQNGHPIGRFMIELSPGTAGTSIRTGEDPNFAQVKTIGEKNGNWTCVPPALNVAQPTKIRFADACSDGLIYFDLTFPETSTIDHIDFCFESPLEGITINKLLCSKSVPDGPGQRASEPDDAGQQALQIRLNNPFSELLQIYQTGAEADQTIRFQLLNMAGHRLLDHTTATASEYLLPTTDLPAGFYLLRVESGTQAKTFKVVKGQ